MDRKSGDIEVEDVYELASHIGDEFQKIIDNMGSDVVSALMPKVIRVLEHLEMLTIRKDDVDSELDSLKLNIYQLEHDKQERAELHIKYEKEMELIDENWRKENLQLTEFVSKLRQKNIKLTNCLIDKETALSQSLTELQTRGQMEIESELTSLNESIKRSDTKNEMLTKEIELKNQEMDKLYDQIETVMQQNRELRRRIKNIQKQVRHFVEETDRSSDKEIEHLLQSLIESPKQSISLAELRNVFCERNNLKIRVNELEDEINQIKNLSVNNCDNKLMNEQDIADLPVQGPINREPDDKLYPGRHQNKILRFFPTLSWPRKKRP